MKELYATSLLKVFSCNLNMCTYKHIIIDCYVSNVCNMGKFWVFGHFMLLPPLFCLLHYAFLDTHAVTGHTIQTSSKQAKLWMFKGEFVKELSMH